MVGGLERFLALTAVSRLARLRFALEKRCD